MKALAIAATGMQAQQTNLEVIANNVANINTTSFKRARAEFTDLLYQTDRAAGIESRGGEGSTPEGVRIGLGVRTAAVRNQHIQGALNQTGNRLDIAILGRGWFQISGADGETLYTRAGAFNRNENGQLVTVDGFAVQPGITIPSNATEVTISQTGQVFARIDGQTDVQELGQLSLSLFANDAGLQPLGDNLYRETTASGTAVTGVAGAEGFGTIRQGYLEKSNVDPVREITELIAAQRAYEMNSKIIQAADEMLATVSNSIR